MGHDRGMSWDLDEQEERELVDEYVGTREPTRGTAPPAMAKANWTTTQFPL